MIAVMFEVELKKEGSDAYFELALNLKASLICMPGFISIERFQSIEETVEGGPAKILSLSFWQDEASVKHWRNQFSHTQAQTLGRKHLFSDYRIRVAKVIRDYSMAEREEAPDELKQRNGGRRFFE